MADTGLADFLRSEGVRRSLAHAPLWARVRFATDCAREAARRLLDDAVSDVTRSSVDAVLLEIGRPPLLVTSVDHSIRELSKIEDSFNDLRVDPARRELAGELQDAVAAVQYAAYAYKSAMHFAHPDSVSNTLDAALATARALGERRLLQTGLLVRFSTLELPQTVIHQDTTYLAPIDERVLSAEELRDLSGSAEIAPADAQTLLRAGADGVAAWNTWRQRTRRGVALQFAQLQRVHLVAVDLMNHSLYGACFSGSNLVNAYLNEADLRAASFVEANLLRANFAESNAFRGDFRAAEMSAVFAASASFVEADLRGASLGGGNLFASELMRARLGEANLKYANLYAARLGGAHLGAADLGSTNLCEADLSETTLTGATLTGTILSDSRLQDADVSGAAMGRTVLHCDLTGVTGLETVKHSHPSSYSREALAQASSLPYVFLRGTGLSREDIDYFRNLRPQRYASLFLSYSRRDRAQVETLYRALLRQDVQCWMDSERMRLGQYVEAKLYKTLETSERILVCYSEAAATSDWVGKEVQYAMSREGRAREPSAQSMLLPIDLDGALERGIGPWASELASRHYLSFVGAFESQSLFEQRLSELLLGLRKDDPE